MRSTTSARRSSFARPTGKGRPWVQLPKATASASAWHAVTGVGAKAFLTNRIVLEARRLLVHTRAPVATISEQLGFDEATNFVKFFRREAGVTPGAFRTSQLVR